MPSSSSSNVRRPVPNPGLSPAPSTKGEWAFALSLDAKRKRGMLSRSWMMTLWSTHRKDVRFVDAGAAVLKAMDICYRLGLNRPWRFPVESVSPPRKPFTFPSKSSPPPRKAAPVTSGTARQTLDAFRSAAGALVDDDDDDYPTPALDRLRGRGRIEHKAILPGWAGSTPGPR